MLPQPVYSSKVVDLDTVAVEADWLDSRGSGCIPARSWTWAAPCKLPCCPWANGAWGGR